MTKTPGQVAREAWWKSSGNDPEEWDDVAAAVIAHYEESQNRPIETAPKDGTPILAAAYGDSAYSEVAWRDPGDPRRPPNWYTEYEAEHFIRAGHYDIWRPLPVPPKARPE